MIIYIYQGMMALGKGGSIMRQLRRETQEGEAGVRSVKRNQGQTLIKGWHQQNVH